MRKKDLLLAIFVTWIWGANYSIIGLGLKSLDPFMLMACRFTLCAIPLCFFIKRPNVKWRYTILYGIVFGVGIWGMVNLAMYYGLPAGVSSVLLQSSAFFTILLSVVMFKERISKIQYLGILFSIAGVLMMVFFTQDIGPSKSMILAIIAAFSWSVCNIIIKKSQPEKLVSFIIWSSIFSAVPLFALSYILKGSAPFINLLAHLDSKVIFSICFQSYITTLFGYWIWNMLLKKYESAVVAPISLFIPIFGIGTSHYMFNETVDAYKIFATFLMMLGVLILLYGAKLNLLLISLYKNISKR